MSLLFGIFECPLLVTKMNFSEVPLGWTLITIAFLFPSQLFTCSEMIFSKSGYSAPTDSWLLYSSKSPSKASLVTESFLSLNRIGHHKPTTTSWLNPKTWQVQVNHAKLLPLAIPPASRGQHKVDKPANRGCGGKGQMQQWVGACWGVRRERAWAVQHYCGVLCLLISRLWGWRPGR